MPRLDVTDDELDTIIEALDSHAYWQLSEETYRDSGYVEPPGSDDPDTAEQIKQTEALIERLEHERSEAP